MVMVFEVRKVSLERMDKTRIDLTILGKSKPVNEHTELKGSLLKGFAKFKLVL